VGISKLFKQNTRIVWVSLRLSLNLVKLHQDRVGISTLVPQSSQTKYQDSVGISTLVPQSHISIQLESVNMENSVRQTRTRIATQIYRYIPHQKLYQLYKIIG
jgi:hypothetical protein